MKLKLDENIPARAQALLGALGHDVHTAASEGLCGKPDAAVWKAVVDEGRFLITQDLDFSDLRAFRPGTHPGVLLLRLREPGAGALVARITEVAGDLPGWAGCFVVVTDLKVRVRRP